MAERASSVYISRRNKRSLRLIARAEKIKQRVPQVSADEICDRLLSEAIATKYPDLAKTHDGIDRLENEAIAAMADPAPED